MLQSNRDRPQRIAQLIILVGWIAGCPLLAGCQERTTTANEPDPGLSESGELTSDQLQFLIWKLPESRPGFFRVVTVRVASDPAQAESRLEGLRRRDVARGLRDAIESALETNPEAQLQLSERVELATVIDRMVDACILVIDDHNFIDRDRVMFARNLVASYGLVEIDLHALNESVSKIAVLFAGGDRRKERQVRSAMESIIGDLSVGYGGNSKFLLLTQEQRLQSSRTASLTETR